MQPGTREEAPRSTSIPLVRWKASGGANETLSRLLSFPGCLLCIHSPGAARPRRGHYGQLVEGTRSDSFRLAGLARRPVDVPARLHADGRLPRLDRVRALREAGLLRLQEGRAGFQGSGVLEPPGYRRTAVRPPRFGYADYRREPRLRP